MRSLFAKVLLWFWGTIAVTVVGSALISAFSMSISDRQVPLARFVNFQLAEARHAYETGGREGLARFMDRLSAAYRGRAFFTDYAGRDLLTGDDRSQLIARLGDRDSFVLFRPRRTLIVRAADDGRYRFFFIFPRPLLGAWFLLPQHWWILALAVILCYWLAWYIVSPVRKIQQAVERFGGGDLDARVNFKRRDELGQLARAIDQMAGRIQTLLAAERRLLGDISHELRSPLARLGVAIELARSGENRDAALDRIQKESDRLNELVGQLLEVTRAEGDPSTLRAQSVRLDELLARVAGDCAFEAQARGCSLAFPEPPPCTVQGDPELLHRALENIIRNAIRYAPEGTAVDIMMECAAGLARVRVRDYGQGVPPEALPRIFDPFFRVETDRGRSSGGVGLGLAIARRAAELHKGTLQARNAGPGLEVAMELPGAKPTAANTPDIQPLGETRQTGQTL